MTRLDHYYTYLAQFQLVIACVWFVGALGYWENLNIFLTMFFIGCGFCMTSTHYVKKSEVCAKEIEANIIKRKKKRNPNRPRKCPICDASVMHIDQMDNKLICGKCGHDYGGF